MKKIRLQQKGKKKQAFYTLVVTEERSKQSGKVNEKVGYYNPMKDNTIVAVNKESILKWLRNGAKMTNTARSLISKAGILLDKHLQEGIEKGKITEEIAKKRKEDWNSLPKKNIIIKFL